jgi:hypothetical protein
MDLSEPRCRISTNSGEEGKYGKELLLKMGRSKERHASALYIPQIYRVSHSHYLKGRPGLYTVPKVNHIPPHYWIKTELLSEFHLPLLRLPHS